MPQKKRHPARDAAPRTGRRPKTARPRRKGGRKVIALLFQARDRESDLFKIGVLQYARPLRDWAFIHCSGEAVAAELGRKTSRFDGGIGEFGRQDLWKAARKAPFPVVNLYGGRGFGGMPKAGVDDREIGRMAAQHLLAQGHRNFAFFGISGRGFCQGRWSGFRAELCRRGFRALRYKSFGRYPRPKVAPLIYIGNELSIAGWLTTLPKPCAVFCCDDFRAEWIAAECQNLGIRVPEEVSILGVDDDDVHCLSALPNLSSIRLPVRKAGYEAAKMLDALIGGRRNRPRRHPVLLLPPEKVVPRESTDRLAIENPNLVKALRHIHACAPSGKLSVPEVVAQTGYCRRILESKFKQAFGRTIFQEIRNTQLEKAKSLLRETGQTMENIAESTGWGTASHFGVEFKKLTGLSPGQYRRRMR